jgi:hypothetical protein
LAGLVRCLAALLACAPCATVDQTVDDATAATGVRVTASAPGSLQFERDAETAGQRAGEATTSTDAVRMVPQQPLSAQHLALKKRM